MFAKQSRVLKRRRERLKRRTKRDGAWARSRTWRKDRLALLTRRCEVSGRLFRKGEKKHLDHILPFRLAVLHGDPDLRANLICISAEIHAVKSHVIEPLILRGDWVGAVASFRRNGWPMNRVVEAFKLYGFPIGHLV
jgi:hypothetical protein